MVELLVYGGIAYLAYKWNQERSASVTGDGVVSTGNTAPSTPQVAQAGHVTRPEDGEPDMAFNDAEAETAAEKAKGDKYLP